MHMPLLLAALQGVSVSVSVQAPTDTVTLRADSAAMATAYHDASARDLVRLARGHRGVIDASVFHYTTTARQRVSIGLRALRRDRILYRREVASTVEWWRDRPGRVVVHGAREAVPLAMSGVRVPDEIGSDRSLVFDPSGDRLWVNPSGSGFAWHPLVEGGEALYRYATGDTTSIRLPDGREVRLVELRVTPRARDFRVVTGSFWIELESHAVVRAVFRPAREFDVERDLAAMDPELEDDVDEVPGILKPVRVDVRYVTVEYGLWEMRWWMPRLIAFEGSVSIGPVRVPATVQIAYSDYTVEADRHGLPELPPLFLQLAGDPHSERTVHTPRMAVVIPDDTASLLVSPSLPESFFGEGEAILSETEARELGDLIGGLPPAPWEVGRPTITPPWALGHGLLRYNRVEGVSAGARVDWDLARVRLDLTARLGAADLAPRAELGVEWTDGHWGWRAAGYRRLAAIDPATRPFALGNSLTALVAGRDEGLYQQTTGAELRLTPADGSRRYEVRVYGERQEAVDRETNFSLSRLAGGDGFGPNIRAMPASQAGASARLGVARGLDPVGRRWGVDLDATAETGSFTFLRPGLTLWAGAPLAGGIMGAVEIGAGTTLSPDSGVAASPVQSHWFLGGPRSLRGFTPGELSGPDHARARVELATRTPAARIALFSDAGWAGRLDHRSDTELALSAGVGASVLDGLIRIDLARAIQPVARWRLEFYLDALF